MERVLEYIYALGYVSVLEYIALLFGLLYVFFLIKEKPIAWVFGFISSLILVIIMFNKETYMQTLLNIYYAIIAIYGYITWTKRSKEKDTYLLKISELSIKTHVLVIIVTLVLSASIYKILSTLGGNYPFLDASVFCFSIVATFLQARKVLSNWLYWIVINSLTIYLFIELELYPLIALTLIYLVMAILGFFNWREIEKLNRT